MQHIVHDERLNYLLSEADSLARGHLGRWFSTRDQDNDASWKSCAGWYHSAWWYNDCYNSNLNGRYAAQDGSGVAWYSHNPKKRRIIMRFTEMKMRPH